MREIKFRGKRKDNGEWVYGYYYYNKQQNSHYIINCQADLDVVGLLNYEIIGNIYEVIPETVGQYTGLKNRNNKEIYEGDIILYMTPFLYDNDELIEETEIVEFVDGAFDPVFLMERDLHDLDDKPLFIKNVEIIGNIYDNPDLMGKEG